MIDKYFDLSKRIEKKSETVISIAVGEVRTVFKGLEKICRSWKSGKYSRRFRPRHEYDLL